MVVAGRAWAVVGLVLAACAPAGTASPLSQDAFVWQRTWSPAVRDAVAGASARGLRRVIALVEEVEWDAHGNPLPRPSDVDLGSLRGLPVGLAVRVGVPRAGWSDAVPRAARDALARARVRALAAGFEPAELHLDIDVPTSRLGAYASALPDVRAGWPGPPLTITGLPTWTESDELPAVLAAVDGWVLQVHWLRRVDDRGGDGALVLMDASETDAVVTAASELDAPFRVALPTYRQAGVRADPAALAERVAAWSEAPPPHMAGLAWFRLPVAGERDTWPGAAFDAVRAGRAPRASGRAEALASSDVVGTWDVRVVATGEDELVEPCVRVTWTGGRALATDGIGAAVSGEAGCVQWALAGTVRPGDAPRTLGWIRLAPGERIDAVDLVAGGGCAGDADARVGVRAGHDGRGDGERIAGR